MPLCHTLTHKDESGARQLWPIEEGVEHILPLALQLVQLIQHQQAAGRGTTQVSLALPTSPQACSCHPDQGELLPGCQGATPTLLPGQTTHTIGPWAVSFFSSLRTPSRPVAPGRPSSCAMAGKMPAGLLSAMQFRTMVLLPVSSACQR